MIRQPPMPPKRFDWITVKTITVRREFELDKIQPAPDIAREFKLHRDCGLGCTCDAGVLLSAGVPTAKHAESKCLCFSDVERQGISEIKGTAVAIESGPLRWVFDVRANVVKAQPIEPPF